MPSPGKKRTRLSYSYLGRTVPLYVPHAAVLALSGCLLVLPGARSVAGMLFFALYWFAFLMLILVIQDFIRTRPYPFPLSTLRAEDCRLFADDVLVPISSIRSVRTILGVLPAYRGIVIHIRFFEITLDHAFLMGGGYRNIFYALAGNTFREEFSRKKGLYSCRLFDFLRSQGFENEKIGAEQRIQYKKLF